MITSCAFHWPQGRSRVIYNALETFSDIDTINTFRDARNDLKNSLKAPETFKSIEKWYEKALNEIRNKGGNRSQEIHNLREEKIKKMLAIDPSLESKIKSQQNPFLHTIPKQSFPKKKKKNLNIYQFDYDFFTPPEYPNNIIVNNGNELQNILKNKEVLSPNTTIKLAPGNYKGCFEVWQPNIKIEALNQSSPPVFTGGSPYALIFHQYGSTASHLNFDGGKMGIRLNKKNNEVRHCDCKNHSRLAIDCKADNSNIVDCTISKFQKDGIFIQGDSVSVLTCNIYDYIGQEDAHNDAIQVAAKIFDGGEKLTSGKEVIKNLKIMGCTIDMGNDTKESKGENLQGIFAGQVMLDSAVIANNNIAVDSAHGITGSFLGESLVEENILRKAGKGKQIPFINLLASRKSNQIHGYIKGEYSVLVGKNEWKDCDTTNGEKFYNVWNHNVYDIDYKNVSPKEPS